MSASKSPAFTRNIFALFAFLIAINTSLTATSYAQDGFAGDFAPGNWSYGENPGGQNMINTSTAPQSITIKNYSQWAVSGAGMAYTRPHPAGKVTFTYSLTGAPPTGCPPSYMINNVTTVLSQTGSKVSFDVPQDQSFGFALNGQGQPQDFGCKNAGYTDVAFTISDFSFNPSVPPPPPPPPPTTITASFTTVTSPTTNNLAGVARIANGRFVAVGASGTTIYSDNGTSWTANTALTNTPNLLAVAASGSSFAAVGASVTPNYNLFFSADGISWSGFFRDPAAAWNGITYPTSGDGYFLAVGGTSLWNPATSSQDYTGYAIERGTASGNEWLNRYTMPQLAAGNSMALNAAAWNASNVIVAVGINGIARSTNGTSWAAATKPVTYPLNDIVWGRSLFIAVGVGGGITTSPDGITWTTSTSGTTKTLKGVACSPTWCIAVGDGVALTSTDGITWVLQSNLPTDSGFVDVVWGGSQFIAVGTGGKIWRITSQ